MTAFVAIGTGLTLLGLLALGLCIAAAFRARRAGLDEAAMRARLTRLVAWNMAALFTSLAGLMVVVVGLFLA